MSRLRASLIIIIHILGAFVLALTFNICNANPNQFQHQKVLVEGLSQGNEQKSVGPSTLDIISARGFVGEFYSTKSRDGAPLSLYHIINPHANQKTLNRYPVLVLHGVTLDSSAMIAFSERQSARAPILGQVTVLESDTALPLLLSNNNFDVYIMDARGTNLNNHLISTEFNPIEASKYWNFSLDDQIHSDLTAAVDFVLLQSHADKLHYIGYSESTFFMFALLASRPEYQNRLASFVALAPVSYVSNITGFTLPVFALSALVPEKFDGNFIPSSILDSGGAFLKRLCYMKQFKNALCLFLTDGVTGAGDSFVSNNFYNSFLKSTSTKSVRHFIQLFVSKRFAMYDYGPWENLRVYGSERSPDYKLSNIHLPSIILFRGDQDLLSDPLDQRKLLNELGTKPYLDMHLPGYSHADFLVGLTVIRDVHWPATKAMFELLKLHASRDVLHPNQILKDPNKTFLAHPYQPTKVQGPDGKTDLSPKSNFVNNLVEGLAGPGSILSESLEQSIFANDFG